MFPRGVVLVALIICAALTAAHAAPAYAQAAAPPAPNDVSPPAAVAAVSPTPVPERFSIHAQSTDTQQYHGAFPAAYSGAQSLYAGPDMAKTIDATLFLGARVWRGGALYVDPELDQGFGLGQPARVGSPYFGTVGAAGFFSGEAYKLGRDSSYGRIQRAFVRQTVNLGGDAQPIDPAANQLGGSLAPSNLIVTAGKFSVTDVFDNNPYAHDPKADFLNWTLIDMACFDYAADAWGYTYGASAELTQGRSTLRAGLFQLSRVPNQIAIESVPFRQFMSVVELERRTSFLGGHPGSMKALFYADDGYMGSYADAIAAAQGTELPPSTANVRDQKHVKVGGGLNLAQEIAPNIGVFARASAMNGTYEAYEFADVDRSFSAGLSIDGSLYHRPNDTFGLAGAVNAISQPAQAYFAAGGLGILIGDGALAYGAERITETYYKAGFGEHVALIFDYQRIVNPAYNTARGPVSAYALRYHAEL